MLSIKYVVHNAGATATRTWTRYSQEVPAAPRTNDMVELNRVGNGSITEQVVGVTWRAGGIVELHFVTTLADADLLGNDFLMVED